MIEWNELEDIARQKASAFGDAYLKRLDFEIKEINKQALNQYWIDLYEEGTKFDHNKNGLVLPLALGITEIDPIKHTHVVENTEPTGLDDLLEIELDNGNIIVIPANVLVSVKDGKILSSQLKIGDEFV